jgi:N-acetylglucosaminyldiphosphoundecaprenol N-acetyl-beta-D-mannosaminyltransferase
MQIFWIKIDKLKYKDLFEEITKLKKQSIVFTPNPEILLKTLEDKDFKKFLEKADYRTPDWIGLYIAFQILDNSHSKIINTLLLPYFIFNLFFKRKWLYKKYGERICGSDLTKDLIDFASEKWVKITIIDLYNPTDEKKVESQKIFKKVLQDKFKKLDFDYFVYDPNKKEEILKKVSKSDSQILFSTLGNKKQEESVIEIMKVCKNIKIWLGIGSSFDYFIWFQKRAPKIWRKLGFEWFYRLFTWPRKLNRLKRLWNATFVFTFKVIWKNPHL